MHCRANTVRRPGSSHAHDTSSDTGLPLVAHGLGQVEEMYAAMSSLERAKNEEIAELQAELGKAREKIHSLTTELEFVMHAVEQEAQLRDAADFAVKREKKHATFERWRRRLCSLRQRRVSTVLADACVVADAAVEKHGLLSNAHPRSLSTLKDAISAAEEDLIHARMGFMDEIGGEFLRATSGGSSSFIDGSSLTSWQSAFQGVVSCYDTMSRLRCELVLESFRLEHDAVQLAGDCVMSLAAAAKNASAACAQEKSRNLPKPRRLSQPRALARHAAAWDTTNDLAVGFVHFAKCAPLVALLDAATRRPAIAEGITPMVELLFTLMNQIDARIMVAPLTLRLRDVYRNLARDSNPREQTSTAPVLPLVKVEVETVIADVDALLQEASVCSAMKGPGFSTMTSPAVSPVVPSERRTEKEHLVGYTQSREAPSVTFSPVSLNSTVNTINMTPLQQKLHQLRLEVDRSTSVRQQ